MSREVHTTTGWGEPVTTSTPTLPPRPRIPALLQSVALRIDWVRALRAFSRRYGDVVTLSTIANRQFVVVFGPSTIKPVFQGSDDQMRSGEIRGALPLVLGEGSLLLLDGPEHLRHRRLILPSFHGEQMRSWMEAIKETTDLEIDSWPIGEPFPIIKSMQALTLRVIIRVVFGYAPGPEADELGRRLRSMIQPVQQPERVLAEQMGATGKDDARAQFEASLDAVRAEVDELLFEEISKRRTEADLDTRTDVFSTLLLAEDQDGQRLSDQEVRDELVTLLVAGHETTATGLAWAFDFLLHSPATLKRACEGDDDYLDAVAKEALRMRPVVPLVARVVRGGPFTIGPYEIPENTQVQVPIQAIHGLASVYPQPNAFRPERFLVDDPPDTYTWIPFGGGTRRCPGASFSLMEMRIILKRILERATLRAGKRSLDKPIRSFVTLTPRHGVMVVQDQAPAPVARVQEGAAVG